MMKYIIPVTALAVSGASAFTTTTTSGDNGVARSSTTATTTLSESKADLEDMAKKLNPILGYWDPLDLVDAGFWGFNQEKTIGWLRQSEVKHGRIAMAAFVGYCVQSNFVFPWSLTLDGLPHPSTDLSPPEQWDALPFASKFQIIAFIGFLEFYSEMRDINETHYVKGGKPGDFPPFIGNIPHFMPFNLYDPFNLSKNKSEESKARGLISETNNGRLAMLGIFGFLCEQTTPGSVPLLTGIVKPYAGEVMAPFSADFTL